MLVFTNRSMNNASDESAFERSFTRLSDRLGMATVTKNGAAWQVTQKDPAVADNDALVRLVDLMGGASPVLVYLHGNNNTPAQTFDRCARLEAGYGVATIAFSWASEGYLPDGVTAPGGASPEQISALDLRRIEAGTRRSAGIQGIIDCYRQAKNNAQDTAESLARLLRLIGTARLHAHRQGCSIAAHSLGAHLLQHTMQVEPTRASVGTVDNIVLLAPCVRAAGHASWLADVMPSGQLFVCYNRNDSVLWGANFADGHQIKLGTDPGSALHPWHRVRYVDFTNAIGRHDTLGHEYFVPRSATPDGKALFKRLFTSQRDFTEPPEDRWTVYPVGCTEDRLTCFMGFQPSGGIP